MTFRITIAILICLTISLAFCKTPTNLKFSILKIDSTIKPTTISINDLAKDYKLYQGQYIETSGRFIASFENFSIMTESDSSKKWIQRFWLDPDKNLKIGKRSMDKMNGKTIKIKGMIDTTRRGHLSLYLATITKIYSWEKE